jgi:hypothetical protein
MLITGHWLNDCTSLLPPQGKTRQLEGETEGNSGDLQVCEIYIKKKEYTHLF